MKQTVRILFLLLLAFAFATTAFAQDTITVGDTVEGEADGDVVEYEIELADGQVVVITLESDAFDPHLFILDEDGEELDDNDDGFDTCCNSQLEFEAEDDATYIIQVNAFGGGANAEGDFELSVEEVGGDDEEAEEDEEDEEDVEVSSGEGDMAYGDETEFDVDGEDELEVTFEGSEGDAVTIIARSEADQDLIITLLDPDDDELAIFDQFTFGDAALIRIPLEADGIYTIVVEERNGEELADELEIELIETEILDLGAGPQTTEITSSLALDYMVFEAAEDDVYLIYVTLDGDVTSGIDVSVYEEDDDYYLPSASVGISGIEEALFAYEASDDGLVTLELEYFAFDDEIEVTIEIELQD